MRKPIALGLNLLSVTLVGQATAANPCLTKAIVAEMTAAGFTGLWTAPTPFWREGVREVSDQVLSYADQKVLREIREAGGEARVISTQDSFKIQVTKAPRRRVFSREFTVISRDVLRRKSDFYISVGRPLEAKTLTSRAFTEGMRSVVEVGDVLTYSPTFLRHEYRHFLDGGPDAEAFLSKVEIPPSVQEVLKDLKGTRFEDLPEEKQRVLRLFHEFADSVSERRTYGEQLGRMLRLRGFSELRGVSMPLEAFAFFKTLPAMPFYGAKSAVLKWYLSKGHRTVLLTVVTGGRVLGFLFSLVAPSVAVVVLGAEVVIYSVTGKHIWEPLLGEK